MADEPTDVCSRCGHTRMVHEPHCVVTYYALAAVVLAVVVVWCFWDGGRRG